MFLGADICLLFMPRFVSLLDQSPTKTRKSPKKNGIEHSHFSTADRTIFEELKYSLFARDSQFVMKGGKKHHARSAKEVPFPRSYERIVLDQSVLL